MMITETPPPPVLPGPDIEFAFVVQLNRNTNQIEFVTDIGGIPTIRRADANDVMRGCSEVISGLQAVKNAMEVVNLQMRQLKALSEKTTPPARPAVTPASVAALAALDRRKTR